MRRKIIFIDIDGPLAWGTWGDGQQLIYKGSDIDSTAIPYPLVQEDCDALGKILKETNASLVVSSDWKRHYGLYKLQAIFEYYGIGRWHILDVTPNFHRNRKMSSSLQWDRANEILSWVKLFKPSNWIAIDDLPLANEFKWMKPRIPMWRHVQVDGDHGNGGRLRDKIDECIKKLER